MGEPEKKIQAAATAGSQPGRRSREQLAREVRLALAVDGLELADRQRARGFDPYDSGPTDKPFNPWAGRRR